MTERWRPVVGFRGLYEVSDLGRVRNVFGCYAGHVLAASVKSYGRYRYRSVCLKNSFLGLKQTKYVHHLVLEAFVGPRPSDKEARHLNGNSRDNKLLNLCWGTKAQNEEDKQRHGTVPKGEQFALTKLSEQDVKEIRRRIGEPQADLANEFGCTFSNISAIQLRKSWRHVGN